MDLFSISQQVEVMTQSEESSNFLTERKLEASGKVLDDLGNLPRVRNVWFCEYWVLFALGHTLGVLQMKKSERKRLMRLSKKANQNEAKFLNFDREIRRVFDDNQKAYDRLMRLGTGFAEPQEERNNG